MIDKELVGQLFEARKKYDQVYYLDVADGLIYRPLTEAEFIAASSLASKFSAVIVNDLIVEKTCLYVKKGLDWLLNYSPAGLIDHIADRIIDSSRFKESNNIEAEIEKAKEKIDYKLSDSVHTVTLSMFPNIRRSELSNMSYNELVLLLAKASVVNTGKLPEGSQENSEDILSPGASDRLI